MAYGDEALKIKQRRSVKCERENRKSPQIGSLNLETHGICNVFLQKNIKGIER